jgi:excisionase family DNA binding protein
VAEVAGILKLNQQTVRNWIDQGSLPALRVGRRVRIRREDFQALVDRAYTGGQPRTSALDAQAFWSGEEMPLPHLDESAQPKGRAPRRARTRTSAAPTPARAPLQPLRPGPSPAARVPTDIRAGEACAWRRDGRDLPRPPSQARPSYVRCGGIPPRIGATEDYGSGLRPSRTSSPSSASSLRMIASIVPWRSSAHSSMVICTTARQGASSLRSRSTSEPCSLVS